MATPGQLLQSVSPGSVNLLMKRLSQYALGMLTPQKPSQGGDDVLETETVIGLCRLAQELLDLVHSQGAEGGGMLIELQESQEVPQAVLVPLDRGLSHAAYFPKIGPMRLKFSLDDRESSRFTLRKHLAFCKEPPQRTGRARQSRFALSEPIVR